VREEIRGPLRKRWETLVRQADRLVANPPSTEEPPKYGPGWKVGEPRWLKRRWGNRVRAVAVVGGAATLAFGCMIWGDEKCGRAASDGFGERVFALTRWRKV